MAYVLFAINWYILYFCVGEVRKVVSRFRWYKIMHKFRNFRYIRRKLLTLCYCGCVAGTCFLAVILICWYAVVHNRRPPDEIRIGIIGR
jgi:hypothetical protein